MTVDLNRSAIAAISCRTRNAHPGLLLARGLNQMASGQGNDNGTEKVALLERVCNIPVPEVYKHAYARWQAATADDSRFRHLCACTVNRLFIGLSASTAVETGVCTQHSYGMPMIPGSSVKGCARAWAVAIGMTKDYRAVLFGEAEDSTKKCQRSSGPGSLIWHDAWWIPSGQDKPFVQEVVTVHHKDYYTGKADATDFESPVPNAQLAVQGSFHFVVEGDPAWADLAIKLLQQALEQQGIGAKRAAGYGFMQRDGKIEDKLRTAHKTARLAELAPDERILAWLADMDEDGLIKLATEPKKAEQAFLDRQVGTPQDWLRVPALAQQAHPELIGSWASASKKTEKKRYRAYRFFSGQTGDE